MALSHALGAMTAAFRLPINKVLDLVEAAYEDSKEVLENEIFPALEDKGKKN